LAGGVHGQNERSNAVGKSGWCVRGPRRQPRLIGAFRWGRPGRTRRTHGMRAGRFAGRLERAARAVEEIELPRWRGLAMERGLRKNGGGLEELGGS
jgi:hypothetical protein